MEQDLELHSELATETDSSKPITYYFEGNVPPVGVSFAYKVGLGVVLMAMIALPLFYVAIVTFAGWTVYLYATWGWRLLSSLRHFHVGLLFIYVAPLVAGVILVCFMIKPIFSGFRFRQLSIPIGHVENPELFRFIGQLCQLLGAPIPSRVDVQLGVNASAGFRAGFSSLFGNDIMLTLGLPLIAGLNCSELAGVLAHELGHFRQRVAMRFGYIINSINRWFGRAVYQRDELDAALEELAESSGFGILIFLLARIAIGITRGILFLFMLCSHALNSFMSRQMEFHADACSLAVTGTEVFLHLHQKLRVLDYSESQVFAQLKGRVQPKMPDDLSTYVALMASQYAGETQGKIFHAAASYKSKWYDSHPSDARRSERARKANLPGLIHDTRSATCLFGNFSKLSKELTSICYGSFRRPITQAQLFQVEVPNIGVPDTAAQEAAIKQFFGGLGPMMKPLLLDKERRRLAPGSTGEKMEQLRNLKLLLENGNLLERREALKQSDAKVLHALQQQALLQAGLLYSEASNVVDPEEAVLQSNEDWNKLCVEVEPFENAAIQRLTLLLSLVRITPGVAGTANAEQLTEEVASLLHLFGVLSATFPTLLVLRKQFAKLQVLLPYRHQAGAELLEAVLENEAAETSKLIEQIHHALGATAYPFKHVRTNMSVVDYARAKEFDPDTVRMTYKEAESHLQLLFALYLQVLGRLAEVASSVESAAETNLRAQDKAPRPVVRIEKRGV